MEKKKKKSDVVDKKVIEKDVYSELVKKVNAIHTTGTSDLVKGVYIQYVGGEDGGFYKFFKKYFVTQGTVELNISWPSNFFKKYFMALQLIWSLILALTFIVFQGG